MDLIQSFQLQWLEQSAATVAPVSLQSVLVPTMLMFAVVVWAFAFSYLRAHFRYLPHLNLALLIGVIGSFQACADKQATAPSQLTGVTPTLPPGADDLGNYANNTGTNPTPGYQNIRVFNPRQAQRGANNSASYYLSQLARANPDTAIIYGYNSSNIQSTVAAECLHYNALLGKTVTAPGGVKRPGACEFINTWEDFPGDQTHPPSIGVKRVLNECRGNSNALLLDMNSHWVNYAPGNIIRTTNARPFPVLAFCVREGANNGNPTIQILNPRLLTYEIIPDSANTFTSVNRYADQAGWFIGSFNDYENGRISTKATTIQLAQNQGTNQAQGAAQPLVTPLPSVKVVVTPEGANAAMAEYKMMTTLTDAVQESIRGGPRAANIVNPANGEVAFDHADLTYPLAETALNLSITRSYRSFNNEIGDFGYNWAWVPSKEFYAFATPLGDIGEYAFYRTDDGRLVSKDTGPFWPTDENNPSRPDSTKNFFMWGLENSLFDLAGRLISLYDGATGNRLYYLRQGSGVAMIADQTAARSDLRQYIYSFWNGLTSYNPANPLPSQINKERIRASALSRPGNAIYFLRNQKGYIQAVIDKLGNFVWYYYGDADGNVSGSSATGDHLNRVVRFVTQDSSVTGRADESIVLYNYAYVGPDTFGRTYSGLISRIQTWDRSEDYANSFTYARNPRRFGTQPQVTAATVEGLSYTFDYNYVHAQDATDPYYQTTVIDYKGSANATIYTMNPTGQVIRVEGPTDSSSKDTLYEAKWNPKLLRITDVVNHGIETLYNWDEDSGALNSTTLCADRDENGNRLLAVSTDAGCRRADLARVTEYTDPYAAYYIDEWFKDLTGNLIPLNERLPDSDLYPYARIRQTLETGCFGGLGIVDFNGQSSGERCSYQADAAGGNTLSHYSYSQFQDGTMKALSTIAHLPRFDGGGAAPYWTPGDLGIFNDVNQTGMVMAVPAAGANQVYDPNQGLVDLSGDKLSFRGIYGESLAEKHPWGAESRIIYDYRLPIPKAVAHRVLNLKPINRGGVFESASGLTGSLFQNGVTMELGERPRPAELAAEISRAFGVTGYQGGSGGIFDLNAEAVSRFLDSTTLDNFARPSLSFERDGSKITSRYTAWGTIDDSVTEVRKDSASGATLSLNVDYQYDNLSRRLKKIVNADGTATETVYRTSNDFSPLKTIEDKTSIGGVKTETETLETDWAGRALRTVKRITSGYTQAPTTTNYVFEYSPFGELKSKVITAGGYSTTTTFSVDLMSGVITSEQTLSSGANVDTTPKQINYSDFDQDLTPRTTVELPKNIQTSIQGVPGKEIHTLVTGPTSFASGSPTEVVYSNVTEKFDGCGNTVSRERESESQRFGEAWDIAYDDGLCKVANYYPHRDFQYYSNAPDPDLPQTYSEYSSRVGYMSDGSAFLQNTVYTSPIGQEGSVSFQNSFVSDCGRTNGRCTTAGRLYSFQASGFSRGPNFLIEFAEKKLSSSDGSAPLQKVRYVSDRITTETGIISSPVDYSISAGSLGSTSFSNRIDLRTSSQTKTGGGSYISTEQIDPVLGVVTESNKTRTNPLVGGSENSSASVTIDPLGRQTAMSFTGDGLTRTSQVMAWNSGSPQVITSTQALPGGASVISTVNHSQFSYNRPTQTSYSRTQNGIAFQAQTNLSLDGVGRPTMAIYTQTPPTSADSYSVTHSRGIQYDSAGRIVWELNDVSDTVTGATTQYTIRNGNFGDFNVQRGLRNDQTLNYTPLAVTYSYYRDGVQMEYEGFKVRYYVADGPGREGRILKVAVLDPARHLHVFSVIGAVSSPSAPINDPYYGLMDSAGSMTYVDEDRPWWDFVGFTSDPPPLVRVNNKPTPRFVVPWTVPFTPSESSCPSCLRMKDVEFKLNINAGMISGFDGTNFTDNNLLNRTFSYPRSSASPNSTLCDQGNGQPSVGNLSVQFDDQRRVAVASRTISRSGSTPAQQGQYLLSVYNGYDGFGLPAIREQVISYRSSNSGNFYSGPTPRPQMVIKTLSLNASAPEGVSFPQRALTLVDHQAGGASYQAGQDGIIRDASFVGKRIYVWGPLGPIFSFSRSGQNWQRRDYIYDQKGNVKNIRCAPETSDCEAEPSENEAYLPYLTSVISRYRGPMTYYNQGGSGPYYVSGVYDGPPFSHLTQNYSWEPQVQPLTSRFGGMGADRDILGILYTNGKAYNSIAGTFLEPESYNSQKVCYDNVGGMATAQAVVDSALGRNASTQATMTRSVSEMQKAAFVQQSYFQNLPWWMYSNPAYVGVAALGLLKAHEQTNTLWYFKDQMKLLGPIGIQAYYALRAADFVCTGTYFESEPGTLKEAWGLTQIGFCIFDIITLGAGAAAHVAGRTGARLAAEGLTHGGAEAASLLKRSYNPILEAAGRSPKDLGELEKVLDGIGTWKRLSDSSEGLARYSLRNGDSFTTIRLANQAGGQFIKRGERMSEVIVGIANDDKLSRVFLHEFAGHGFNRSLPWMQYAETALQTGRINPAKFVAAAALDEIGAQAVHASDLMRLNEVRGLWRSAARVQETGMSQLGRARELRKISSKMLEYLGDNSYGTLTRIPKGFQGAGTQEQVIEEMSKWLMQLP